MSSIQQINIRFSLVTIILVLMAGLFGIFFGLALRTRTLLHESILSQARSHFQSIVLTRAWNAQHGGVYVLKTAGMESNPYLENPDIYTSDGKVYTQKNPASMTREISMLAGQKAGMKFHITSLRPLNPSNRADEFETQALRAFVGGKQEEFAFMEKNGAQVFRYMAPLITEESCLTCHRKQGYKVGDIRGGISVSILVEELQDQLQRNMVAIGLSGIVVTIGLVVTISLLIIRLVRLLNDARRKVEKLAVTDGLTGVYNRRHGMELLAAEVNKADRLQHPLSCLVLDIDHFKKINDNYGHDSGDKVLVAVAKALQQAMRSYDVLFRFGGEEFVVVLPGLTISEARVTSERIRQMVADLQLLSKDRGEQIELTASGGLTSLLSEESSPETLLKRADIALYRAKALGRNRIELNNDKPRQAG